MRKILINFESYLEELSRKLPNKKRYFPYNDILLCDLLNKTIILLLVSFSHQLYLMVFHWSLSDSKFPWIFRISELIVTVPWCGKFWFFLWLPVHTVFFPGFWRLFQGLQLWLVSLSPLCSATFSVLKQSPGICLAFCLSSLVLCGQLVWQNQLDD